MYPAFGSGGAFGQNQQQQQQQQQPAANPMFGSSTTNNAAFGESHTSYTVIVSYFTFQDHLDQTTTRSARNQPVVLVPSQTHLQRLALAIPTPLVALPTMLRLLLEMPLVNLLLVLPMHLEAAISLDRNRPLVLLANLPLVSAFEYLFLCQEDLSMYCHLPTS